MIGEQIFSNYMVKNARKTYDPFKNYSVQSSTELLYFKKKLLVALN